MAFVILAGIVLVATVGGLCIALGCSGKSASEKDPDDGGFFS